MVIVQLSAVTLVPSGDDRTPLTPGSLKELILKIHVESDRVEHVKVIEQAGLMWVGAYISVDDKESAQRALTNLCARVTDTITGWEIIRESNS